MLAGNLDSRAVKYMQARVSHYEHTGYYQEAYVTLTILKYNVFSEGTGNSAIILLPHVKMP